MANEIASFEMQVNYVKPQLDFNLAELDSLIRELEKQYNGVLIIDESDYATAKKNRAKLNNISKAINDKKIEISKAISEPIKAFESEIKKRVEQIASVSKSIDKEVKTFEDELEKQKELTIKALPDYADFIVFNDKWLQKGYELKTIEEEVKAQKLQFQSNCRAIEMTCQAYGISNEKYYKMLVNKETVDDVMLMIQNDIDVLRANASQLVDEEKAPIKKVVIDTSGDVYTKTFTVKGSKSQLLALKDYMTEIGVEIVK